MRLYTARPNPLAQSTKSHPTVMPVLHSYLDLEAFIHIRSVDTDHFSQLECSALCIPHAHAVNWVHWELRNAGSLPLMPRVKWKLVWSSLPLKTSECNQQPAPQCDWQMSGHLQCTGWAVSVLSSDKRRAEEATWVFNEYSPEGKWENTGLVVS